MPAKRTRPYDGQGLIHMFYVRVFIDGRVRLRTSTVLVSMQTMLSGRVRSRPPLTSTGQTETRGREGTQKCMKRNILRTADNPTDATTDLHRRLEHARKWLSLRLPGGRLGSEEVHNGGATADRLRQNRGSPSRPKPTRGRRSLVKRTGTRRQDCIVDQEIFTTMEATCPSASAFRASLSSCRL